MVEVGGVAKVEDNVEVGGVIASIGNAEEFWERGKEAKDLGLHKEAAGVKAAGLTTAEGAEEGSTGSRRFNHIASLINIYTGEDCYHLVVFSLLHQHSKDWILHHH